MAKYQRVEEEDNGLSYSQELLQQQQEDGTAPAVDAEDATYKKRYGDLRRHSQQMLSQKEQEVAQLRAQLEEASKAQIKFPKTDEEIEAWSNRYPDVAKIVDTIARKRANEALEEGKKQMAGLRDLESKISRKEAEQVLLQLHPDFAQIRASQDFHDWVALQPQNIQDALYKNTSDARSAARAIDLYKADTGTKTKRSNSAAQSVGRSTGPAPTGRQRASFSESQIEQMTDKEFEKNQEAIQEAIRSGNFSYDITGAAR